jgi:hypothetical protein
VLGVAAYVHPHLSRMLIAGVLRAGGGGAAPAAAAPAAGGAAPAAAKKEEKVEEEESDQVCIACTPSVRHQPCSSHGPWLSAA